MKTLIVLFSAFLVGSIGWFEYKEHADDPKEGCAESEILLDSSIIRKQIELMEQDSIMTVYMLNQMDLRPKMAERIIDNLERHHFLDSVCAREAISNIHRDAFINCCL